MSSFQRRIRFLLAIVLLTGFGLVHGARLATAGQFDAGFARIDITPQTPLRLSGYGNRDKPFEGIDEPLFARAMALKCAGGPVHVLVSVETLGFSGVLTARIHKRVEKRFQVARAQFVLCSTHTHTAPFLLQNASNLFATPLTEAERREATQYEEWMADRIVEAVADAIEDMAPSRVFTAQGKATFARNRRVLKDGKWAGFGIEPDGPVDHSLPMLKITDARGHQVRGILFNYACHCTTFDSDHNRVNGDWAGYATKFLEAKHPDAIALCTIGCGADANPERNRERAIGIAKAQGRQVSDEIDRLFQTEMAEVTAPPQATFGFAGLPIDRPTAAELKERLEDRTPQVRQHANNMLATLRKNGRLPESYPMPIQVWRFGEQMVIVFLGGEVCVDYATRIKKELKCDTVWATAYANDVFGYVVPERMRTEGGYEVDFSMIYYNLPGRWSSGTEEVILRRVHDLFDNSNVSIPLSVDDAIESFTLPEGFAIDIVAAEPLIADPVGFAVGADGRLWVVEMGDYPRGARDDGKPGGRVKVLTDHDGDGRYDEAALFLDNLAYPTSVFPWRDGALVSSAPDILFAKDTDGDGRADERTVLYTGYQESNPQHRVNGFAYGLDGWLYMASGDNNGEVTSMRTGATAMISGRDSRIRPDRGLIEAVSGPSQYGRCRDDWGN